MDVDKDLFNFTSIAWRCSNQFISGEHKQSGDIKNYKIFYPVTDDLKESRSLASETKFFDIVKKCQSNGKQFAIVNLSLSWNCGRNGHHSNAILFDFKNKTVERFEPYGAYVLEISYTRKNIILVEEFDKQFSKAVKAHTDFTYRPADLFCPRIGPQTHEHLRKTHFVKDLSKDEITKPTDPGGFCAAWSLWYLNLRLQHPHIPPDKLIHKALKKLHNEPRSYTTFIRNYSQFIIQERERLLKKYNVEYKNTKARKFNVFVRDELRKIINRNI